MVSPQPSAPLPYRDAGLGTRERLSLQGPVNSNSCKPVMTIRLYGRERCSVFPALQGTSLVTAPNSWAGPGTWRGHGFGFQERRMPKPLRCGTPGNGDGGRRWEQGRDGLSLASPGSQSTEPVDRAGMVGWGGVELPEKEPSSKKAPWPGQV